MTDLYPGLREALAAKVGHETWCATSHDECCAPSECDCRLDEFLVAVESWLTTWLGDLNVIERGARALVAEHGGDYSNLSPIAKYHAEADVYAVLAALTESPPSDPHPLRFTKGAVAGHGSTPDVKPRPKPKPPEETK